MTAPNPPRPYWQAEVWRDGQRLYSSGPIGAGIELRAAIPEGGGSWLTIRWLTSAEAQEGGTQAAPETSEFASLRDAAPPPTAQQGWTLTGDILTGPWRTKRP